MAKSRKRSRKPARRKQDLKKATRRVDRLNAAASATPLPVLPQAFDSLGVPLSAPYIRVPRYAPKPGGLAAAALGRVTPVSKQRPDPAKDRVQPRNVFVLTARSNKSALKAFNAERRKKRNSSEFAFDVDCIEKPSSGSGNSVRHNPTPEQKRRQTLKGHSHARKWC